MCRNGRMIQLHDLSTCIPIQGFKDEIFMPFPSYIPKKGLTPMRIEETREETPATGDFRNIQKRKTAQGQLI